MSDDVLQNLPEFIRKALQMAKAKGDMSDLLLRASSGATLEVTAQIRIVPNKDRTFKTEVVSASVKKQPKRRKKSS